MKQLSQIKPFVRLAVPWTYRGEAAEGTRTGYTYAFHLFTDAKGYVIVDGIKHTVEKGSLVFIRPGQAHSFHHQPGFVMESYNAYCDLWEEPERLNPRFAFHPELPSAELMTRIEHCPELDSLPTHCSIARFPYLIDLFSQVSLSLESARYARQIMSSLMQAFLLRWYNSLADLAPGDYRIRKVLAEMESRPELQLDYEYWCERCGLEKSRFYKLFKLETGMAPKAYLTKIKMKKAAILLQDSRLSITLIAEQLGYDSIHYFSKQFSAYYGISPSRFRAETGDT